MATADVYAAVKFTANGRDYSFGSRSGPATITLDGYVWEFARNLATATTLDLWEAGTGELADFDIFGIESTQALYIELTTDKSGSFGTVVSTIYAPANTPLILPSNISYANHTANFATGTADVIDRIRIRNVSGSTAVFEGFLAT